MEDQTQPPIINPQQGLPSESGKSKVIISLLLLIIIILIGLVVFLWRQKQTEPSTQQPATKATVGSGNYPNVQEPVTELPTPNTIYQGKLNGQDGLFITNTKVQTYYDNGTERRSPYVGEFMFFSGGGKDSLHFQGVEGPKVLLDLHDRNGTYHISSAYMDAQYIYLSIANSGNNQSDIDRVNRVNLDSEHIWSFGYPIDYARESPFTKDGAITINNVVEDKYAILYIGSCGACDAPGAHGTILLNMDTGNDQYLGEAENVQIDLSQNSVEYQKLSPAKQQCTEPIPGCDNDGMQTVYNPSGPILTEKLP